MKCQCRMGVWTAAPREKSDLRGRNATRQNQTTKPSRDPPHPTKDRKWHFRCSNFEIQAAATPKPQNMRLFWGAANGARAARCPLAHRRRRRRTALSSAGIHHKPTSLPLTCAHFPLGTRSSRRRRRVPERGAWCPCAPAAFSRHSQGHDGREHTP